MLVWRQPLRMAISRMKLATPPTSSSFSTFTATTWTPPRSALNTWQGTTTRYASDPSFQAILAILQMQAQLGQGSSRRPLRCMER